MENLNKSEIIERFKEMRLVAIVSSGLVAIFLLLLILLSH